MWGFFKNANEKKFYGSQVYKNNYANTLTYITKNLKI